MRVKVFILSEDGKYLASLANVQAVVDEAKLAFGREANIRIMSPTDDANIVEEFAEENPRYVLTPKCDEGGIRHSFTRVGRWFRSRSAPYTFRGGAVVFVVKDVLGEKAGCFVGPLVDYGWIDKDALVDSGTRVPVTPVPVTPGRKLTFAHELGHACDLLHRDDPKNLMAPSGAQRTTHLTRWQRSVVRSSPRVRYR